MEFIPSVADYHRDLPVKSVWSVLERALASKDGIAYYKHPSLAATGGRAPDLAILAKDCQPIVLTTFSQSLDEIADVSD